MGCLLLFAINSNLLFAFSINQFKENNNLEQPDITYIIKLNNGDIISANIIACVTSVNEVQQILKQVQNDNIKEQAEQFIPFLIVKTFGEEIFIYEDEIMNISIRTSDNNTFKWQNHSLFLMPTANPISNNHFIGNYELFFLFGGIGIFDYVSLLGAYSFIPWTATPNQIAIINAKVSIPPIPLDGNSNIALAAGFNYGQINRHNKLQHIFGIATYNNNSANPSNFSVGMFYKIGAQEYFNVLLLNQPPFGFYYSDGSFGLCGGFEKHFNTRKDLSLLLEIWNADVTNGADTGILLGLRLAGKNFYTDFGLTVITTPLPPIPFFSFVWMPFGK
jgi:hypothetical protein